MIVNHQFFQTNKRLFSVLVAVSFLILFCIVWLVFIKRNDSPDEKIFAAIAPHITAGRTGFMKAVSFLGNHKFLIPANFLLIALLLFKKKKWEAGTVALVSLSSLGLMSLLKNLIQRQRPSHQLVDGITNFSFPSGHAFMCVAFYGLLIWLTASYLQNNWQRKSIIIIWVFLILLIGFSRIYLRVHYPTDVIAGFCIGTIWIIFMLALMNKLQIKMASHKKK